MLDKSILLLESSYDKILISICKYYALQTKIYLIKLQQLRN